MALFYITAFAGIYRYNNIMNKHDVIIIGAGPAGLFTGIHCAGKYVKVCVLEKKLSAGQKLLISGGRKGNISHIGEVEEFIPHYGDNGKFLKPALYNFPNKKLIEFFTSKGLKLINNDDGNIFPQSLKAVDVLNLLIKESKNAGVTIKYGQEVKDIIYEDNFFKVITNSCKYTSKYLVLATGGKSYPLTGSTGDGYAFAKKSGHAVIEPKPALTSVYIKNHPFADLSGMSFKNINIFLYRNNKKVKKASGDLLINHKGISGPVVLNMSRYIVPEDVIKICFIAPDARELFRREFYENIENRHEIQLKSIFNKYLLPKRLIQTIFQIINISEDIAFTNMDKKRRNLIMEMFMEFPLTVECLGDFDVAMVTRGGVSLKQVNPKTMESRLIKNLYFVGEILDIDGDTGGYNLQAAFSTAAMAGDIIKKGLSLVSYK